MRVQGGRQGCRPFFYTCMWLLVIWTSGHLDNGHSDFWSSGHLDFWPSFSMPKNCPNWDILDLPCCYTNLKFLTFSLESKTTNMLLPTFHAQFSRETTKPKTQPGRLAASWHIWYSFLSSRLQKDCFFSFFYFFPLYFSLFRENGTIFQMLNYIVVVQFGMEVVLSTAQSLVQKKQLYILKHSK